MSWRSFFVDSSFVFISIFVCSENVFLLFFISEVRQSVDKTSSKNYIWNISYFVFNIDACILENLVKWLISETHHLIAHMKVQDWKGICGTINLDSTPHSYLASTHASCIKACIEACVKACGLVLYEDTHSCESRLQVKSTVVIKVFLNFRFRHVICILYESTHLCKFTV